MSNSQFRPVVSEDSRLLGAALQLERKPSSILLQRGLPLGHYKVGFTPGITYAHV